MNARRVGTPPRWLKPMNRVLVTVQRLGLGMKELPVLTLPGRRSGQPRRTPLTILDLDGQRYVLQGYARTDWVANLRAAGTATVHQGRRAQQVRMTEVPAEQARPLLRQFPVLVPTGVSFIKNAGLVTGPNPDEFEALAGRLPVFRFDEI